MRFLLFLLLPVWLYAQPPATRPIIFVHGMLASGDTWDRQAARFLTNGYPAHYLHAFDWNTTGGGKNSDSAFLALVERALQTSGADQVELVGHSAGGMFCRTVLGLASMRGKVAHYAHIGSNRWFSVLDHERDLPKLQIYSDADAVIRSKGEIETFTNINLRNKDHYQVATSPETFRELFRFFTGKEPETLEPPANKQPVMRGRAVELGTNRPLAFAELRIARLDGTTGQLAGDEVRLRTDEEGYWGPYQGVGGFPLRIELRPSDGGKTITYYFESLRRDHPFLYLRGFGKNPMLDLLLSDLPSDSAQSALVLYSSTQAVIAGRDTLSVDHLPLSSPALTPAARTVISTFVYDANRNKTSEGTPIGRFAMTPFLQGVDAFLPSRTGKPMTIRFNGRSLVIPALPSSQTIQLVVFD